MSTYNIVMTATDAGFTATLKRAQMELMLTTAKVNVMNTAMAGLRTGTLVGAGSLAAMILPALLASKAVGQFEATVRRAVTVGGGDWAGKFNELSRELVSISKSYGVAMDDLSSGVVEFAKAGFNYSNTMEDLILPTTKLATVHLTDFATTAAIATYTWQLYGKSLVEQGWSTEKVFEKLNVAANETMLDIEELGHAIQYAGSNAVVAGMKYEEFLAVLGAMRQLAYSSDQTLGTLINRILVSGSALSKTGKTLESIIGAERGSIVKDGILNITLLMQYLDKLPNKFEFTEWAAEAWGVRSANVFNVLANVTQEYDRLLSALYEDTDTLNEQSKTMKETIPALMTRIVAVFKEAAFAPQMMDKMTASLQSLLESLEGGELGKALAGLLISSFDFLAEQGPRLVSLVSELLMTVAEAAPYLQQMAEVFLKVGRAVSKLGGPLMTFVATLYLFNKVLPTSTILSTTAALKMLYFATSKKHAAEMTNKHTEALAHEITMMQQERIMIEVLNGAVRMRMRANLELINAMVMGREVAKTSNDMAVMEVQMDNVISKTKNDVTIANVILQEAIRGVAARMTEKGTLTEAEILNDERIKAAVNNLADAEKRHVNVLQLKAQFLQHKNQSDWQDVDATYEAVIAEDTLTQARASATTANKIHEKSELDVAAAKHATGLAAIKSSLDTSKSAMLVQSAVTGAMSAIAMSLISLQSNAAGWVKAVGVIGAVASMVIPILTHFAMVKDAATIPGIGWMLGIAGAAAVAGMAASLYSMGKSQQAAVESETSTYVSDVYSSAEGGYVKSEGWRYIHPGEFIVPQTNVADVDKHLQLRGEAEFAREERRDEQYHRTSANLVALMGLTQSLARRYGSEEGGYVIDEGWRYIHDGEYIIPKDLGDMAIVDSNLLVSGEGNVGPEGVSKAAAVDYAFRFLPDDYIQMIQPEFTEDPGEMLSSYDATIYADVQFKKADLPVYQVEAKEALMGEAGGADMPVGGGAAPEKEAGFFEGIGHWGQQVGTDFKQFTDDIGSWADQVGPWIDEKAAMLGTHWDNFWGGIYNWADQVGPWIDEKAAMLGTHWDNFWGGIGNWVDQIGPWFEEKKAALGTAWDGFWGGIRNWADQIVPTLGGWKDSVTSAFAGLGTNIGSFLGDAGNWLGDVGGAVTGHFATAGTTIKDSLTGLGTTMTDAFGGLKNTLSGFGNDVTGALTNLGTSIGDFFSGLVGGGGDVIDKVGKWLGFQEGGYVPYTGWAYLHGGEYIVSHREAMEAEAILRRRGIGASLRDVMTKRVRTEDKSLLSQTATIFADRSYVAAHSKQEGGVIGDGGWYLLHSGEYVAPSEAFEQSIYDLYNQYASSISTGGGFKHKKPRPGKAFVASGIYEIYPELIKEEAAAFLSRTGDIPPDMRAMIEENPMLIYDKMFIESLGLAVAQSPSGAFAYSDSIQAYKKYKDMMRSAFTSMGAMKLSEGKSGDWLGIISDVLDAEYKPGVGGMVQSVFDEYKEMINKWSMKAFREYMYGSSPAFVRSGYQGEVPQMYQSYDTGGGEKRYANYYDYRNVNVYDAKRDEVYRAIREAGMVD